MARVCGGVKSVVVSFEDRGEGVEVGFELGEGVCGWGFACQCLEGFYD
jgi:hypothetical protein